MQKPTVCLDAIMRAKGISRANLAQMTGLAESYLSLVARGQKQPSIGRAMQIASAIGAPVTDIFLENQCPPMTARAAGVKKEGKWEKKEAQS